MTAGTQPAIAATPNDQLLEFNRFAREAVQMAINDAALRQATTQNDAERRAIGRELIKLFDEQMNLEAMNIVLVANSPAMQTALRDLTAIVAELEHSAARLKSATAFVADLAKVTGFAKQTVDGINNVMKIGAKPPKKKK